MTFGSVNPLLCGFLRSDFYGERRVTQPRGRTAVI